MLYFTTKFLCYYPMSNTPLPFVYSSIKIHIPCSDEPSVSSVHNKDTITNNTNIK